MFDTANPSFQKRVLKEAWLDSRAKKIRFLAAELSGLKLNNAPDYVSEKVKELRRKINAAISQIRHEFECL